MVAEEQRTVLNRALSHRLKNTLSVVHSVATRTLGNTAFMKAAQTTLNQRIMALAGARDVLLTGTRMLERSATS